MSHPRQDAADPVAIERPRMERWCEAFAVVNGWAPRLDDFTDGTFTVTFEPDFDPIELLGGTGHFLHHPALAEHIAAMGFRWSDAGRVLTAPSPESFNRLADRLLPPGAGYRVTPLLRDQPTLALGPLLRAYLAGRVPIHLSSDALYDALIAARGEPADRRERGFQFRSFAHDLTVHALNYQLVPRAVIDAIADRITAALPARVAAWDAPDAPGPLTLTTFFDNDLNRFCYALWWRCDGPADFADLCLEHLPHLLACLDQRIAETLQGLGDIPDGDTRHLPPIAPWEFDVKGRPPPPPPEFTQAPPGPSRPPPDRWVVPAGQEALVRRLLSLEGAPEGWRFLGASVGDTVVGRYRRGAALAVVTLEHPDRSPRGATLTARFAVSVRSAAPVACTAALASAVFAAVRAHEEPFRWVAAGGAPP